MGNATVFREKRHPRQRNEKYFTPDWATLALLENYQFASLVWEPAAGDGGMARALVGAGKLTFYSDISPDDATVRRVDFLASDVTIPAGMWDIITNPPFGVSGALAVKFIERALRLTRQHRGRVAMLLRADFDSAPGRVHLFKEHPALAHRVVLLKRIRWTNLPQKEAGPSTNHTWFVWDWSKPPGLPTVSYAA